ncbi:MAG: DUF6261 family protein [Tannerella sp.]|nr:DUF6261 family protein [Tannerella sp.]
MVKFKKLRFGRLPNGAHYDFFLDFDQELTNSPDEVLSTLGTWPAQFRTNLAEEKKWMEWVAQGVLTDRIEQADKEMDHDYTAIRKQVQAQIYNPTPATVDAAKRVYAMLQKYGDVNRKPYREEEGDLRAILQQLQQGGAYCNDAVLLGLVPLISALQTSLTLFQQLLKQRGEQSLLKPTTPFSKVRRNVQDTYYPMVDLIDAGALLNTSSAFATFINHLNPMIDMLNAEFSPVKHDISECEPEPIQPQQYTGLPLTPSPVVLFRTPHDGSIRLELGKDYNLSFRDNTEVGNAQCTITGRGGYRGHKTVTFVIIRIV